MHLTLRLTIFLELFHLLSYLPCSLQCFVLEKQGGTDTYTEIWIFDYSGTCETNMLNFNMVPAYLHNHIKLINKLCAQYAEYFMVQ
jgi:hypothetical protein